MSSYEYTVIPAPARGEKTKGAKTGIDRFAATLSDVLNDLARDGWEYVRAETLPAEERSGLTSRNTVYHNVLIFRRALDVEPALTSYTQPQSAPEPLAPALTIHTDPEPEQASSQETPEPIPEPPVAPPAPAETPVRAPFSQPMRTKQTPAAPSTPMRAAEPPLTRSPAHPLALQGPRLGPASR